MSDHRPTSGVFEYLADTPDGTVMAGTIQATDADAALLSLKKMGLIVTDVRPQVESTSARARGKPLRSEDLLAFNEQLAQLAASGMSMERGLRLMADDMPGKALREAIEDLAADLEAGNDFDRAMDRHAGRFPAMYGAILRAGMRTGDLPGTLANLGQHLIRVRRLQSAIWQAASYPLMILFMLALVLVFISQVVAPPLREVFAGINLPLPALTEFVLGLADLTPWLAIGLAVGVIAASVFWQYLKLIGRDAYFTERWLLPMPLVGPALRYSKVAHWCSALAIAIDAGMDLPLALRTAGEAGGSPMLMGESSMLAAAQRDGDKLSDAIGIGLIPAGALASIDLAINRGNLPEALRSLSGMYQQQAEQRLTVLRYVLLPALVIAIGCGVAFLVLALYLPASQLIGGAMIM